MRGKIYFGGGVWLDAMAVASMKDSELCIMLDEAARRAVAENPKLVSAEIIQEAAAQDLDGNFRHIQL